MTARARALIDEMALVLVSEVDDMGNDTRCVMALVGRGFHSSDIFDFLDAARDIARAARAGEAELWDRLMRAEQKDPDT